MIIKKIIESMPEFFASITHVSCNSKKEPLCDSDNIVFWFEKFHDKHCKDTKCVDAITISYKPKEGFYLNLLEFKGGIKCTDWDEYCLEFKGFDTIHCGIPKLLAENRIAWQELFNNECYIRYFIICEDENELDTPGVDSRDRLLKRGETQKRRTLNEKYRGNLKRYRNRHPYEYIDIIAVTHFKKKYLASI